MTVLLFRRVNELKSDIDIPDDVLMTFEQFWLDFKDKPLKGYLSYLIIKVHLLQHRTRFLFISRFHFCSFSFKDFNTITGRNAILRAICPQIFGLFTVKLAGNLSFHK